MEKEYYGKNENPDLLGENICATINAEHMFEILIGSCLNVRPIVR